MSSAECRVHLVGVNRLSACRELFGVHSCQNGTRCRDGHDMVRLTSSLFRRREPCASLVPSRI